MCVYIYLLRLMLDRQSMLAGEICAVCTLQVAKELAAKFAACAVPRVAGCWLFILRKSLHGFCEYR